MANSLHKEVCQIFSALAAARMIILSPLRVKRVTVSLTFCTMLEDSMQAMIQRKVDHRHASMCSLCHGHVISPELLFQDAVLKRLLSRYYTSRMICFVGTRTALPCSSSSFLSSFSTFRFSSALNSGLIILFFNISGVTCPDELLPLA